MTTAEWQCTKCGATNRRLVLPNTTYADDRCYTCRTHHTIEKRERPVFWHAAPKT